MSRRRIAQAATIIMLGNLLTSVLGYARQAVTGYYFQGNRSDAWFAAYTVPQMFYDLVIGGAIAAAMIPTFTRLAETDREHFWRAVTTIAVLASLVIVVLIIFLEIVAQPFLQLIASGFLTHGTPAQQHRTLNLAVELTRVILPTLLFWGLSAVSLAALYSLGRRVAASFATACFHLGIILGAVILAAHYGLGALALPIGAVAGAAAQFTVQLPSLWRSRAEVASRIGRQVDFHDPAVRRIVMLYGPVAVGILVSIAGQIADLEFKTRLQHYGWYSDMQYATTLIQFPVGIVVAALGLAVLPMISSDAAAARLDDFKDKLGLGFRVTLVLMLPAALGYMLLGTPIADLLYRHGHVHSVSQIALALLGYAPQLPFIGIDQLLIFAFYARQNTLTPMLAGVAGVCVYVISALVLDYVFHLQVLGLAVANTIQITFHALLLLVLLLAAVGRFKSGQLGATLIKVVVATAVMSAVVVFVRLGLGHVDLGRVAVWSNVLVPMAAAVVAYAAMLWVLRLEEVQIIRVALMTRIRS